MNERKPSFRKLEKARGGELLLVVCARAEEGLLRVGGKQHGVEKTTGRCQGDRNVDAWATWDSSPFGFFVRHVISGMRMVGCGGPDPHPSLRGSREMTSVQEFKTGRQHSKTTPLKKVKKPGQVTQSCHSSYGRP